MTREEDQSDPALVGIIFDIVYMDLSITNFRLLGVFPSFQATSYLALDFCLFWRLACKFVLQSGRSSIPHSLAIKH